MPVQLSHISQIAVTVTDLDRAAAFYQDKLGMKPLYRFSNLAFFDNGGIRLMLSPVEKDGDARLASVIYYKVDDIHAAHHDLAGRGVAFEGPPHMIAKVEGREIWMAFFRDSEGNLMAIAT